MDKIKVSKYSENLKGYLDGVTLLTAAKVIQEWIEEYGTDATLDIDIESDYGDAYASVKVIATRLESDEEYENRIGKDALAKRQKEERERAEYERLKAKFGE